MKIWWWICAIWHNNPYRMISSSLTSIHSSTKSVNKQGNKAKYKANKSFSYNRNCIKVNQKNCMFIFIIILFTICCNYVTKKKVSQNHIFDDPWDTKFPYIDCDILNEDYKWARKEKMLCKMFTRTEKWSRQSNIT